MTDTEYRDWLLDVTRNKHRLFLIKAHHSAGALYFGSDPWLSDTNIPFDDWIVSLPDIEDNLSDFFGVGDFDCINPDDSINWLDFEFRGHLCEWFFGDDEWDFSEFRQIASSLISECRVINGRVHRFDLIDGGIKLNAEFGIDSTQTGTLQNVVNWIATQSGETISFGNLTTAQKNTNINIEINETTRYNDALRSIADSISAYYRINQSGDIELFYPDLTADRVLLTIDDILASGLTINDVTPAYKKITINYDGGSVSGTTTADTGNLSERLTIETVLDNSTGANNLLTEKKAYYAAAHPIWELKVMDVSGLLQVGDYVDIEHDELTGFGLITRIKRAPMSAFSKIEVEL